MKSIPIILLASIAGFAQTYPSAEIDKLIQDAVSRDALPGAVILIGQQDRILYEKAYGNRALVPQKEAMTLDTIFDCASLTKVVSTSVSIMKLVEQGKVRLNDKVTVYLPKFQGGKSDITVRLLLTHFSGLRPDLDLKPAWKGYETGIQKALIDRPVAAPGERFIYSDINYILLGEIVHVVSGKPLPEFARQNIYQPLGMKETMYQPPAELRSRIAPTEHYPGDAGPLRGIVHDETTKFMGGIAGHAGLFSTARDLSRYAQMLLNGGELGGKRILSPLTVRKFTEPGTPADQPILRGLGPDIDSPFSSNRGELFPIGSFGHTGFTGTSMWMDPSTKTYVILMSNSVHPFRRPANTALRARIATIVAANAGLDSPGMILTGYNETIAGAGVRRTVARNGSVETGLDVAASEGFAMLKGKRAGLITNHTGLTKKGERNIDVMLKAGVKLVSLLAPEHGLFGKEDHENIGHTKDEKTGLKVWSLYAGKNRRPSKEMLEGLDALVFDIQDIGTRFYTYPATMLYAMEEAAKRKIPFYVLDRPNPIDGVHVEGPMLDPGLESFIAAYPLPLRHGMTLGELARMFNGKLNIGADLHVIQMKGWQRGDWYDSTGLPWTNPSPNMRSLQAALLYPGVGMMEYSKNYSVGRGTDAPFEQVGADWMNARALAQALNQRKIPGVRIYPIWLQPTDSYFKGSRVEGLRFMITDREQFRSVRLGLELAVAYERLHAGKIDWKVNLKLIGNQSVLDAIRKLEDPRLIFDRIEDQLKPFLELRQKYLLY